MCPDCIFPIPEIEQIILNYLNKTTDLLTLLFVNKYFYEIISAKNFYPELKNFYKIKHSISVRFIPRETNKSIRLFWKACQGGYIHVMKYLLEKYPNKIDIHSHREYAFQLCCKYGHTDAAEWLYQLSQSNGYGWINIHSDNEWAFRHSCEFGHLGTVKWLYHLSQSTTKIINIHVDGDFAFKQCCLNRNLDVVQWLCSLDPSFASHGKYAGYFNIIKSDFTSIKTN